jgi:hypothetical protein
MSYLKSNKFNGVLVLKIIKLLLKSTVFVLGGGKLLTIF